MLRFSLRLFISGHMSLSQLSFLFSWLCVLYDYSRVTVIMWYVWKPRKKIQLTPVTDSKVAYSPVFAPNSVSARGRQLNSSVLKGKKKEREQCRKGKRALTWQCMHGSRFMLLRRNREQNGFEWLFAFFSSVSIEDWWWGLLVLYCLPFSYFEYHASVINACSHCTDSHV